MTPSSCSFTIPQHFYMKIWTVNVCSKTSLSLSIRNIYMAEEYIGVAMQPTLFTFFVLVIPVFSPRLFMFLDVMLQHCGLCTVSPHFISLEQGKYVWRVNSSASEGKYFVCECEATSLFTPWKNNDNNNEWLCFRVYFWWLDNLQLTEKIIGNDNRRFVSQG